MCQEGLCLCLTLQVSAFIGQRVQMPGFAVKRNHSGSVLYSKGKIQLQSAWKSTFLRAYIGRRWWWWIHSYIKFCLKKKRNILDWITEDLKRSFQALRVLLWLFWEEFDYRQHTAYFRLQYQYHYWKPRHATSSFPSNHSCHTVHNYVFC